MRAAAMRRVRIEQLDQLFDRAFFTATELRNELTDKRNRKRRPAAVGVHIV